MKKIIIRLLLVILMILPLFILTGCQRDFIRYDNLVIQEFINKDDIDAIEFSEIKAYQRKETFYYNVLYTKNSIDYNILFVCSNKEVEKLVNASNLESLATSNEELYNNYMKAIEKGEYHYLSSDDIIELVNNNK